MFQIIHRVSGVGSLNAWGKGPTDLAVKDPGTSDERCKMGNRPEGNAYQQLVAISDSHSAQYANLQQSHPRCSASKVRLSELTTVTSAPARPEPLLPPNKGVLVPTT